MQPNHGEDNNIKPFVEDPQQPVSRRTDADCITLATDGQTIVLEAELHPQSNERARLQCDGSTHR